jgi:hypothetical protein
VSRSTQLKLLRAAGIVVWAAPPPIFRAGGQLPYQVRVIGVVGEDFGPDEERVFARRRIDTRGIEHVPGKSFFWSGSYVKNLNEAQTLNTELNVFQSFSPKIPAEYQDSEYLFLANIDPVLQEDVRRKMPKVKMVCGDTMNYWIKDHAENLARVLKGLDALLINDTEVRMLAKDNNLVLAARKVLDMGPKALVVKARRVRRDRLLLRALVCGRKGLNHHPVSRAGSAPGRSRRSHRRGRFLCRRVLRLHCLAAHAHARRLSPRHVLRQRHGLLRRGALRNRAPAAARP